MKGKAVKVSGFVEPGFRAELTRAANQHGTSVSSMVALGLKIVMKSLPDPKFRKQLQPDQRRTA